MVLTTVDVQGSLTLNGGTGSYNVSATDLQVGGNLSVSTTNTTTANFLYTTLFYDLVVAGSMTHQ